MKHKIELVFLLPVFFLGFIWQGIVIGFEGGRIAYRMVMK